MPEVRNTMFSQDGTLVIDAEPNVAGLEFLKKFRRSDKRFARKTIAPTMREPSFPMRQVYNASDLHRPSKSKSAEKVRKGGVTVQDFLDLMNAKNGGNTNVCVTLCVEGVPTGDSMVERIMFDANDDGEPGGMVWLEVAKPLQKAINKKCGG